MKLTSIRLAVAFGAIVSMFFAASSNAGTATITALDVRANGIFGHDDNVSGVQVNGADPGPTVAADPINVELTYSNLDIDGDATPNDSVSFTLTATGGTNAAGDPFQRIFNQGIDTGFGNLNDVQLSVTDVSGMTTDLGMPIVFDGFTGAAAGFGGNGDLISSVMINGETVSVNSPNTGAFQFLVQAIDFDATPTVTFDGSVRDGIGTVVARHYDLQFSAVPEPSCFTGLLLGCAGLFVLRRRK